MNWVIFFFIKLEKLNAFHCRYFKRRLSILLEFVPRILFFWPLFGYLMSLMFLKWIKYGANKEERKKSCQKLLFIFDLTRVSLRGQTGMLQSDCAPSILITFINMMLFGYGEDKTKPPNEECETVFMYGDLEGNTQVNCLVNVSNITLPKLFFCFVTQKSIQIAFVLIAILSVPVLLFGTPIEFRIKQKRLNKRVFAR